MRVQHRIQDAAATKKRKTIPVAAQLGKEVRGINIAGWRLRRTHHHRAGDFELVHGGNAILHGLAELLLTPGQMHVDIKVRHMRRSLYTLRPSAGAPGSHPGRRMTGAVGLCHSTRCKRCAEACEQTSAGNEAVEFSHDACSGERVLKAYEKDIPSPHS